MARQTCSQGDLEMYFSELLKCTVMPSTLDIAGSQPEFRPGTSFSPVIVMVTAKQPRSDNFTKNFTLPDSKYRPSRSSIGMLQDRCKDTVIFSHNKP